MTGKEGTTPSVESDPDSRPPNNFAPASDSFKWAQDYGKDILVDLNQLAHAKGTNCLHRDALQRAYTEIVRLRKKTGQ